MNKCQKCHAEMIPDNRLDSMYYVCPVCHFDIEVMTRHSQERETGTESGYEASEVKGE
jgi:DNA-directed RNA polymerase subunit RPC12/RpoP